MTNKNANSQKTIALLGGMGPVAGWHMYQQLLNTAAKEDTDHPAVIVDNRPLLYLGVSGYQKKDKDNIKKILQERIDYLLSAPAEIILPACNTVDLILQELREENDYPLLSLPRLALAHVDAKQDTVVFCSESGREVFSYYLDDVTIEPSSQLLINKIIGLVISNNIQKARGFWLQLLEQYQERVMIIGCTELSVINHFYPTDRVNMIDTAQLAIEQAIKESQDARL